MDLRPLRHRDYRCLYSAQSVSFLGSMVTYVALPYQVYALTGSSLAVGLLGLAELLPLLATAFVGGALADTVDRRRMVLATDVGLAVGSGLLAVNAALAHPRLWPLYVAAAVLSAMNGLQRPSLDAMTPRLVEPHEIPAATALNTFRGSVGMIAGPALGGLLIASAGLPATFLFDVATYVFSYFAVRLIRPHVPSGSGEGPTLESIREGFRYARSRQELIGTYVVDFVAMIFGMPLALFPALSGRLGGPRVLGSLRRPRWALVASLTSRWPASGATAWP
jgi:MFS family permease